MLTWTDQPYSTMWAHLRLLSHEQNARRLLQNNMGGARTRPTVQSILLDQKAAQLSYCVLQAYEYYQAAESVTINTSPLLYFYGMLSLAKATIIANDPDKLLDDIRFHGLQHDKARRTNTVEDQVAILNGGVFDDFINVVAGFRFPRGATFGFKVVLSISPELSNMYERYYPEKARCMYLYNIETLSKDPYKLRVRPQVRTKEEAYARIPELANDFDAEAGVHDGQAISLISKPTLRQPPEYFRAYAPVVGGRYIVGSLPFILDGARDTCYLSPPVSDYISMYILSDCVRYQQELWGSVVQGKKTGVLGMIDLLIAVSKRRFPNLILDQLYGETFEYGSPGRLM
jgi:YaaC-like Protein